MDEIRYLAEAYFHQDYDLTSSEPLGVVRYYLGSEDEATISALRREIAALLASEPGEDALARAWFVSSVVSYDPRRDGVELKEWLQSIVAVLDRE